MGFISESLRGSAMSLTQSLRLLMSSGLIGIAAFGFDGSTLPMSLLALLCSAICIILYGALHKRKALQIN